MEKITKLAREMGVKYSPTIDKFEGKASRKLNKVLRDLDSDERKTLVIVSAAGEWDWHMVDGTRRVWHFSHGGRMSWNDIGWDRVDAVIADAERLIGHEISEED
jgi:hypothetical protein